MSVLCFDISSGGLGAAIINAELQAEYSAEFPWHISTTLDVDILLRAFSSLVKSLPREVQLGAISFSCFMHSCVLLNKVAHPIGPISTWMDSGGINGVKRLRHAFGDDFHTRTGCRFHPMFPVFKLAEMGLQGVAKIVSAKALLLHELTGAWIEDHGTASASGMYNLEQSTWDADILHAAGILRESLPDLIDPDTIVGKVTSTAAQRYSLSDGIPVAAGSGDGFLANLGSACETPARIAVTLGTSASVRQTLPSAALNKDSGTFCYRADSKSFLLGCASNNGGNVLDWGRSVFGPAAALLTSEEISGPVFLPLLNGERSPDWDSTLTASWHDVRPVHSAADLARSILEGVIFNLVHYLEIVQNVSQERADQVIVSGNGFLEPYAAAVLASLSAATVLMPQQQGLASLRGAAVCGLRALSCDPAEALEKLIHDAKVVPSINSSALRSSYARYRELRS